jgi:hypothetical protein
MGSYHLAPCKINLYSQLLWDQVLNANLLLDRIWRVLRSPSNVMAHLSYWICLRLTAPPGLILATANSTHLLITIRLWHLGFYSDGTPFSAHFKSVDDGWTQKLGLLNVVYDLNNWENACELFVLKNWAHTIWYFSLFVPTNLCFPRTNSRKRYLREDSIYLFFCTQSIGGSNGSKCLPSFDRLLLARVRAHDTISEWRKFWNGGLMGFVFLVVSWFFSLSTRKACNTCGNNMLVIHYQLGLANLVSFLLLFFSAFSFPSFEIVSFLVFFSAPIVSFRFFPGKSLIWRKKRSRL